MLKSEKEVTQAQLKAEKAVLKQLEEQYQQTLKDIDEKIADLLARNDSDMQNVIYQVQYQKQLKAQVQAALAQLQANEYKTISDYLAQSYQDGYVGAMYTMHNQGIPMISPIDQNAVIRALQTDSKLSHDLYTELGIDITKLKKSITSEISRGIASGMLYDEIIRNLRNTTKAPLGRAKTIVRTEAHRIQQASAHDAYLYAKSRGADVVKQWDSTLDGDTRDNHRRLDGQIVELEESFKVGGKSARFPGDFGDPAEDCNCRCRVNQRPRWALGEGELQVLKDRADYFGLDKSDSFKDFEKKYMKAAESLENTTKSGIIEARKKTVAKSVKIPDDCEYLLKAETNFDGKDIAVETLVDIDKAISARKAVADDFDFDEIKVARFADGDKSVFITDYEVFAGRRKTKLYLNTQFFTGVSADQMDEMCVGYYVSGWWKSKSVSDLMNHEIMHARINHYNPIEKVERLYDELRDDKRVKGFCRLVDLNPDEFLNEMYVAMCNGEEIDKKYVDVFNEYAKEFLGG